VAQKLGLTVHERDTFTGWDLPRPDGEHINLIVAVSFGLFVPPRILNSAEYGGVNVHPSLLPEFRGPAPLHHTLLAGETHTGVTLQTLHPERFDHGAILAQTPRPGIQIPPHCTFHKLLDIVSPRASAMLIQGIRDRLFVPPIKDLTYQIQNLQQNSNGVRHAPKINTKDRHINWATMTASEICRRDRVVGRLWSIYQPTGQAAKRIIFHDMDVVETPPIYLNNKKERMAECTAGEHMLELPSSGFDGKYVKGRSFMKFGKAIIVPTKCGEALLIREITKDGQKRMSAAEALFGKSHTMSKEAYTTSGDALPGEIGWGIMAGLDELL
jgi:methionyl-tRNA formyltransferase